MTSSGPSPSPAPDLSDAAVRKVAKLARLALDDAAIQRAAGQLRAVLGYVDRLKQLDLRDVEPMAHPRDSANRVDPDQPREPMPTAALLKIAPETSGPFVKVPKVLGGGEGA